MKRLAIALAVVVMGGCSKPEQKPAAQNQMMSDTSRMMMSDTSKMMMSDTSKRMMMADTTKKMMAPAMKPAAKKKKP